MGESGARVKGMVTREADRDDGLAHIIPVTALALRQ